LNPTSSQGRARDDVIDRRGAAADDRPDSEQAGLNTSHIRFYERVGVLPAPERVAGQRRYRADVLHRLSIIDVAQRAGLSLDEIAPLTGPGNRTAAASHHIRRLAGEKLPRIDALIARAQAVKRWLEVAQSCDCESADVCGLFVDPTLLPPPGDVDLDVRHVRRPARMGD
jgi:MerR family transcriptional regulator, redox-sensitive transcriptional activator SoxR